jgi:hypothetical protein
MQVIPRGPNFWGDLGAGLGELAGYKLAQLTKAHEQKKEKEHFSKTWEPLLGRTTTNFLSSLSPEERQNALEDMSGLLQLNQPPSSREQAAQLGGGMNALQQPQQQRNSPQQQDQIQNALQQYFGRPQMGYQQSESGPSQQGQEEQYQPQEQQFNPEQGLKLAQNILLSPQQKAAKQKMDLENRKESFKERQANIAATKEYVTTLKAKEKAAKEDNLRLSKMENLIDKGKLPHAGIWSALSKIEHAPYISGLTAPFADAIKSWYKSGNSDIEEFEKLSNEFVKNAKQYFGSRITEREVAMFMQTVPTLMQTDAGKKKIIDNMKSLNQLVEIESKAARSIIKANGGVAPVDIEQQVQDKIGDKIDKVAKKFIAR